MKSIKHQLKPKGETKYIRINDKTLIEVDVNLSEETARELYLVKLTMNKPTNHHLQENKHLIRN